MNEWILPMNSQVEQVDRLSYADYIRMKIGVDADESYISRLLNGEMDWTHGVQIAHVARHRRAALASQPPVLDEREVKRAFTFAFAVGFQWASERSCVSAASIDEAWSEYTAIRNLGGPDDVA